MYETILVGTDGSKPANRAVVQALEEAKRSDSTVHAIFVVDTSMFEEPALSSAELATDDIEDWGHEQLDEIAERGESLDIKVVTRCCHGKPHKEIAEYADSIDADLIVLGYQGQSHTKSDRIGHVTNRVLGDTERQVLVI